MTDPFGRPLFRDGTFPQGRPSCASAIELALAAPNTEAFFSALADDAKLWGGPWATHLERMSRDLRMLFMTDWLLFMKGTPNEYAWDRLFATYGQDFERWLQQIGASAAASFVGALLDLYPDRQPFDDEDEREAHVEQLESTTPGLFDDLVDRYPNMVEQLAEKVRDVLVARGGAIAADCDALREEFAQPLPLSLADILAIPDDVDFGVALIGWLDAPRGPPPLGFDRQPEVGRMLWVLHALATSLSVDGTTHFLLSHGVGAAFSKIAAWAREIDATTTEQYAKTAIAELKRLAGGRLPPMNDASRIAAIRRLEAEDEAAGGRGLFLGVDEQYAERVVGEIEKCLREYVHGHQHEIELAVMSIP